MNLRLLLTFCISCIFPLMTHAQDAFAVVLMVKNEELVINKTLEPFTKEGIHSFLIFDTGSTDNTVEAVQDFFKENNVNNWYIFQEPFIDFATSRNRALELAEEKFPQAKFFVMPDAEWYMHNVRGLSNFCHKNRYDSCKSYLITVANQGFSLSAPRLIRAHVNARFVGDIHECIVTDNTKKVDHDIFFELGASRVGIEKSKKRWERDLILLLKRHEQNPHDTRTLFYLAQTYECLGDLANAYIFYKIRAEHAEQGWHEETYETLYRLGRVTDSLAKTDAHYSWHLAQDYYFAAHKIMPHRAEPLIKIAEHYWPDHAAPVNIPLCYLFAKRAYELPYPEHDSLFIDPEVYHFKRYDLVGKSAWYMNDFTLGEAATRKALAAKELPHLLRNLACYIETNTKHGISKGA